LCAGIDPVLETLPRFIADECRAAYSSTDDFIYNLLVKSYIPAMEILKSQVACCKINIAFFEQYGIAGMKAFRDILSSLRDEGIIVIVDAKRGDIGSTAAAYSKAFIHAASVELNNFESDCLTVNPFLGSDTVDVFIQDCKKFAKGLFVLVKTSNPKSDWIQGRKTEDKSVSEHIAEWLNMQSDLLKGDSGFSGLGAVVGATYPEEAQKLRSLMPNSFLLIPGFGAQGAAASDALAACCKKTHAGAGLVVNASRGLFAAFTENHANYQELEKSLIAKCNNLNQQLNAELS
jgi:orotidine-5'-phosphate decarboxylase